MNKATNAGLQSLADHIVDHYAGNQSEFARAQGMKRAQVSKWVKMGYLVVDGNIVAVKRELKQREINANNPCTM